MYFNFLIHLMLQNAEVPVVMDQWDSLVSRDS